MATRAQRKILQTRNVLILVIVVCAAKLAKILLGKDPDAGLTQIVALALVIVILGLVLALYLWLDRYTRQEQAAYGQSDAPPGQMDLQSGRLKNLSKAIFKTNKKTK